MQKKMNMKIFGLWLWIIQKELFNLTFLQIKKEIIEVTHVLFFF